MDDRTLIRTEEEALDAGRRARADGKPKAACPLRRYPSKTLHAAWLRGWEQASSVTRVPEVRTQEPEPVKQRTFLPDGEPLATSYRAPRPVPCPNCRCVKLENEAQAVVVRGTHERKAYLWCRACGYQFKLGIE